MSGAPRSLRSVHCAPMSRVTQRRENNTMQLHSVRSKTKRKDRKRIGRGGKRGTFAGRGSKGQKARSPVRVGFRGGDQPLWKKFRKQRGSNKKVDLKRRRFRVVQKKP